MFPSHWDLFLSSSHLPLDQSQWLRWVDRHCSLLLSRPRGRWLIWALLPLPHQLEGNIKLTKAVKPLRLPRGEDRVRPGQKCSVAGWGRIAPMGTYPDTLQEVELTVQEDWECECYLRNYYNSAIQLCVGNPTEKKASFQVRLSVCLVWLKGVECLGKNWELETRALGCDLSPREEKRAATRAGEKQGL